MDEAPADIAGILRAYRVDERHARQVADLALALFDAVAERYGLDAGGRGTLEAGALLHNVGMTTDPAQHHLVGRDIVLRRALEGLGRRDQLAAACLVAFHRKRVRPRLEPAYLSLSKKGRGAALKLAAILRVADGLDYSQSQTTRLLGVEPGEAGLTLCLAGPGAAADGARAVAKADLWEKVFGEALRAPADAAGAPAGGEEEDEGQAGELLPPWYAAPEAPLAELGRVLLRRHMRRMLSAERDVRADHDIEDIHALRVATRRLRATLQLLAPVAPADMPRSIQRGLRRVARAAGAVRDRDVLLAHLAESRGALPAELCAGLDGLAAAIAAARGRAYGHLTALLDSPGHEAFKVDFADLMNGRDGWDEGPLVRDLAGSTIWRHYEAVRAHDRGGLPPAGEELHAMRIDAKKMRYVLELFAETFGPRAEPAVAQLAALQDQLGALNDIAVAHATIAAAEPEGAAQAAAEAYLALRDAQGAAAVAALPARWEKVGGATYRRKLMELVVRL